MLLCVLWLAIVLLCCFPCATKIPLTWETAQEWQNVLKKTYVKGAYSDDYWELPAASTLESKGSIVGLRFHYDSNQKVSIFWRGNGEINLLAIDGLGVAVIRHVDNGGPRYVEMYFAQFTCTGSDTSVSSNGCYTESSSFLQSLNLNYAAKLANGDSYTCNCADCDYSQGIFTLANYRSRYVAAGTGDSFFSAYQCSGLTQLFEIPKSVTNERIDGYAFDGTFPIGFRSQCIEEPCNENAGKFRVEPIFESCKDGYFMSSTGGCYPAQVEDIVGYVNMAGGSTIQLIGINFGSTNPNPCQVRFEGVISDATWISDTRVDIVVPPWTGCNPCNVVLILGTNEANIHVLYDSPPVESQVQPYVPPNGGQLEIKGNFPDTPSGWKYEMYTTTMTGTVWNCVHGYAKSNVKRCDNVMHSSNKLTCDYSDHPGVGGCVVDSSICVMLVKNNNYDNAYVTNITVPICYQQRTDILSPLLTNLSPKSVIEGNAATLDLTLSKAPTEMTVEVRLSSLGEYKDICKLTKSTFVFSKDSFAISQTVTVNIDGDDMIEIDNRICQIQAELVIDIGSVLFGKVCPR